MKLFANRKILAGWWFFRQLKIADALPVLRGVQFTVAIQGLH
jgi:hypothetical protein